MTQQGSCLARGRSRLHCALAYFSVLRPSFIFGAIIVYLPLTAVHEDVPGNSMLANLFVEYGFWKSFWFGFAFFGAVWALMLTTCLSLDFARDRQLNNREQWLPDPGEVNRKVTMPMRDKRTFLLFSLLAVPGVAIVIWRAGNSTTTALLAFAGLTFGCLMAFLSLNLVAALIYADNEKFPVLPWRPWAFKIKGPARLLRPLFSWGMRFAPATIFDTKTGLLKDDHFFAALSAAAVVVIYTIIYWLFKPSGIALPLDDVPPAAFIFALLLPLIWIVTALWAYLSPYRLVFLTAVALTMLLTRLATTHWLESTIGGPSHTYDVAPIQGLMPAPAKTQPRQKLIVVAASGGGILAAGWTAHVLTQLHREYSAFPQELGVISSVSGGSAGAAHYLSALDEIAKLTDLTKRDAALEAVANDAMRSSLASSSYGIAFADFRRVVFPFFADEKFDRGRLIEADWRRIANCRRAAIANNVDDEAFGEFCRRQPPETLEKRAWISQTQAHNGVSPKPVLIFNSTVMETGERIAITPLGTLPSEWHGQIEKNGQPVPPRHAHARTLSEFLSAIKSSPADDPAKQDIGEQKEGSCDSDQFKKGYDIDTWTAARLSATFSYVSPAARATCFDPKRNVRAAAANDSTGRLHLIDGGYHDNYGVASALDWLARQDAKGDLQYSHIALVEIRAKPDIPSAHEQNEWSSAWLGPFWGLFNSWGFAQTSANDTAINQLIARFKTSLREREVCIDSFVFVPRWTGPLSWHLSERQKQQLREQWNVDMNPKVLKRLLGFLSATGRQACPR